MQRAHLGDMERRMGDLGWKRRLAGQSCADRRQSCHRAKHLLNRPCVVDHYNAGWNMCILYCSAAHNIWSVSVPGCGYLCPIHTVKRYNTLPNSEYEIYGFRNMCDSHTCRKNALKSGELLSSWPAGGLVCLRPKHYIILLS